MWCRVVAEDLLTMLHVGVFGAGAIGTYFSARLIDGSRHSPIPFRVTLVGRQTLGDALAASNGLLKISSVEETTPIQVALKTPHTYAVNASALSDCDIVFITVKSADTAEVAQSLAPVLPLTTLLVSLQNGVSNAATIRSALPSHTVLSAIYEANVVWPQDSKPAVTFHRTTDGHLIIEQAEEVSRYNQLINIIKCQDLLIKESHNILADQHSKLLINLLNSINALSGISTSKLLQSRAFRYVWAEAITQGLYVFHTAKKPIGPIRGYPPFLFLFLLRSPDFIYKILAGAFNKTDDRSISSMRQDLERNRTTEIEFLDGYIVQVAKQHSISDEHIVVANGMIKLIRAAEERRRSSGNCHQ